MSKNKSTNVPCDILFDIFTWLPVKSLLRFQSVSTSWNDIISGNEFKKAVLDRSKALGRVKFLSQADGDEVKISHLEYLSVITQKQEFPLKGFGGADILCSHDGLIVLKRDGDYKKFVLWNPSTRQCQELALVNELYHEYEIPLASRSYVEEYENPRACGLCYDSTTDDYKVILIYNLFYVVWSNANRWTRKTTLPMLEQILPTIEQETILCSYAYPQGVTVKGCVYWSLDEKLHSCLSRHSSIIYFDVESDELKVLPTPDFIGEKELFRLTNLKDRLSLYGGRPGSYTGEVIELDIWTMDQDGWKWSMKLRHIPEYGTFTIICFDVKTDEVKEFPTPEFVGDENHDMLAILSIIN
ncbi:hypothetical protein CQW23_22885 [Capsicum baccatum]|uniref:F-box domain-containing protein n=1 Tax=Capsicum baccatum TaxID=33114 RepID=A0A2G2W255_CAPBA|nr:hypothetical protein CQW23_22885 [Capsicum baccatum]